MTESNQQTPRLLRCAIYTRKSTEEGLEQAFNTLQAQREAAESYIQSQRQAGWVAVAESSKDRLSRSTLYTTTQSMPPPSIAASGCGECSTWDFRSENE